MFGGSDFWLETRVIVKISTHSWYPRTFDWFSWKWSKNKIFAIFFKMAQKVRFSKPPTYKKNCGGSKKCSCLNFSICCMYYTYDQSFIFFLLYVLEVISMTQGHFRSKYFISSYQKKIQFPVFGLIIIHNH